MSKSQVFRDNLILSVMLKDIKLRKLRKKLTLNKDKSLKEFCTPLWFKGQIFTQFCSGQNSNGFTVSSTDHDLAVAVISLTQIHNWIKGRGHIGMRARF